MAPIVDQELERTRGVSYLIFPYIKFIFMVHGSVNRPYSVFGYMIGSPLPRHPNPWCFENFCLQKSPHIAGNIPKDLSKSIAIWMSRVHTHMIQVWYIYLYMYHENQPSMDR